MKGKTLFKRNDIKPNLRKKRNVSSKKYRSVMYVLPNDCTVRTYFGDINESVSDVVYRIHDDKIKYDLRRTAIFDKQAVFTAIVYTGKRRFPGNIDCATPLFYALARHYSTKGFELFILRHDNFYALALMKDGEMIGYKSLSYEGRADTSEFVLYIKEAIDEFLNDFFQIGIYIEVDKIVYLYQAKDESPSVSAVSSLKNFEAVIYNVKELQYDDVLNFIAPYKDKFISSALSPGGIIQSFTSYLLYGESHLNDLEKKIYRSLSTAILALSVVFLIGSILFAVNSYILSRVSFVQKDIAEIEQKTAYVEQYKQKYSDLLNIAQNYVKLQEDTFDLTPIVKTITDPSSGVSVLSFNIKGKNVVINISSSSAVQVGMYVDKLMKSGYFAGIDLPQSSGLDVYVITGTLKR
ncbi:MAG: hypothetical protein QXE51_00155 [Nitrososphaeria archaeon]